MTPLPAGDSELVQIMDAALAETARQAGDWLVCRPGCTQCCYGAFAINALDALRLHVGMETLRMEQPALAAEIAGRAQQWIDEHLEDFPGDPETGLLGEAEEDRARFEDFANEVACPALNPATGRCEVYAWRPMTCRVFGPPVRMEGESGGAADGVALGHCELCFIGASKAEVAACEMPVPHEVEARLLDEIPRHGETIVAFALLPAQI
jgi:Fe-S-cluster containining protein